MISRSLRVFLCYASQDEPVVNQLFNRLKLESWISPWQASETILPGQDWDFEIRKAIFDSDVFVICFSRNSSMKEGYFQKEIREVLDILDAKPYGSTYLIPLRIDECSIPTNIKKWQWVDYFTENAHQVLLQALSLYANHLGLDISSKLVANSDDEIDLYRFISIPPTNEVPYSFYIGKFPVTRAQYRRFVYAYDFADKSLWIEFPKYNHDCIPIGKWRNEGWDFLKSATDKVGYPLVPRGDWNKDFNILDSIYPVAGITWYEANAYCNWVARHWSRLIESKANNHKIPKLIRLPLEIEWLAAAGGKKPKGRYPWDVANKISEGENEIIQYANLDMKIGRTTPVNTYARGASPYGVMDMSGNVWEWQANHFDRDKNTLAIRGGSWNLSHLLARVENREHFAPNYDLSDRLGFRLMFFFHIRHYLQPDFKNNSLWCLS